MGFKDVETQGLLVLRGGYRSTVAAFSEMAPCCSSLSLQRLRGTQHGFSVWQDAANEV